MMHRIHNVVRSSYPHCSVLTVSSLLQCNREENAMHFRLNVLSYTADHLLNIWELRFSSQSCDLLGFLACRHRL